MDARRTGVDIAGMEVESQPAPRLCFDRHELAGAFGDLGTDLPLLVGMVVAAGLDAASVLIVFGLLQVATGVAYRIPMPVQPLKAVAAIVIAERVPPEVLFGGALAIGLAMLVLSVSGLLDWIARVVPHAVVRGLQLGLGLQLSLVALRDFIPALGPAGYLLAGACGVAMLALRGSRRVPPAPLVVAAGALVALATLPPGAIAAGFGLALPVVRTPAWADVAAGFVLLALPQLPLSIGNSVLATRQLAIDLFPDRAPLPVRRIGLTYAAMNLVAPFMSGVPVCHGSGGMAGHFAHGGRTGGSVVIYGTCLLLLGLLLGGAFEQLVHAFPLPILGVLLLVEGVVLVRLLRDLRPRHVGELPLAVLVGVAAVALPYGYALGLAGGTMLSRLLRR